MYLFGGTQGGCGVVPVVALEEVLPESYRARGGAAPVPGGCSWFGSWAQWLVELRVRPATAKALCGVCSVLPCKLRAVLAFMHADFTVCPVRLHL